MAKIFTVTAHTAIDFYIEVDGLAKRRNMLAKSSSDYACGKGINVARALAALNIPCTCLGFVGRQSLASFLAIESPLLHTAFTVVTGKTRTNITLYDRATSNETHIRTAGFSVSDAACQDLLDNLAGQLQAGDLVILCGSLPPGAAKEFHAALIGLCHHRSATAFLDSSGDSLAAGIQARPWLIKPNQQELEELTGQTLRDTRAVAAAARSIVDQGIAWVYVSRGADGLVVVGEQIALTARSNKIPKAVISHIGCGDALLAGLAAAFIAGQDLPETIKSGIACGTANLYSREPGQFAAELLPAIAANCEIHAI